MEPIRPASGSANIVPGPRFQTGRPDKLDKIPENMFQLQSHLANPGVSKMGKLPSHHNGIFRAGPHANANEKEEASPCKAKQRLSRAVFSQLNSIEVKSLAHSVEIHIAPVLKTHTVQHAASLLVGRIVGECICLRSTCEEEPKKSTVGFSGQVPKQMHMRKKRQTHAKQNRD